MARCPSCKTRYREPPGEQGDHDCPHCGMWPEDWARWKKESEEDSEEPEESEDESSESATKHGLHGSGMTSDKHDANRSGCEN